MLLASLELCPVRICLISREYPPDTGWGGIGAYTFQHAKALLEAGHDVEVISLCKKDLEHDLAPQLAVGEKIVPVHRAAWGNLLQDMSTIWISLPYSHFVLKSALALWRKFLEVHEERPFDVVEAPEHLAEAIFPALTRICPLVLRLHTPHSKFIREGYHNIDAGFDQRLVSILERTAMLEADLLSSPSVDLASYVAFDTGIDLSTIHIVRNPVDTSKFTPEGERAIVNEGKVTVFFAGRLEERKGVHFLVEAIPQVLAECPDLKFVIVGADTNTGPGKTSVLAELNRKLVQSGSSSAVQFINHVPLAEMPAHYRSADVCVVPSLYENAPYTVLEALASGKPVIGTAAGGTPEYIADGETGLVVPAKDSKALALAIIDLAKNKEKREAMGLKARERAVNKFEKKVIAEEAVSTYKLAIAKHNAQQKSLYKKDAEQSLKDFVQLIYSYHNNLCDLIYRHSLTYRIKHWTQSLFKRPKLTLAKAGVNICRILPEALRPASLVASSEKLSAKIALLDAESEKLQFEKLLAQCSLTQSGGVKRTQSANAKVQDLSEDPSSCQSR